MQTQLTLQNEDHSGAIFSHCSRCRYQLWRTWDPDKNKVLFMMLNPSTADALENDPTIRRCIAFAKSWGYGGIMVGNLSPFISTDPKGLKDIERNEDYWRLMDQNSQNVSKMSYDAAITVMAWGNLPVPLDTAFVYGMYNLHYLGLNKSGEPKHPLYLPKDLKPIKYQYKRVFG